MDPDVYQRKPKTLIETLEMAFAMNFECVRLNVHSVHENGEMRLQIKITGERRKNPDDAELMDPIKAALDNDPQILNASALYKENARYILPVTPDMMDDPEFIDQINALDAVIAKPDAPQP